MTIEGDIKHTILVASGKGGVGKSTVATQLALALRDQGHAVGLLDADIYGPSIPTMLGPAEKPGSPDGKRIFPIEKHGIKTISMGYLVDPNAAMVWRGPMLAGAVTQFVQDVVWGSLDYLIFDLPPGTGDIQLSLAQRLQVSGSILVTTPQEVALADVVRAKAMFDKVRIPTLGLVENMSYFVCDGCDKRHEIFSSGGGRQLAESLKMRFLGEIPMDIAVRLGGDLGEPNLEAEAGTKTSEHSAQPITIEAFKGLACGLKEALAAQRPAGAKRSSLRIVA